MTQKVAVSTLVKELKAAAERHDGYIMGATGQDPRGWKETSWWFTQYTGTRRKKALYWREHAARVWDCNGLAEGIYRDAAGIDINTKARHNFGDWCSVKGWGTIPEAERREGMAVFKASARGDASSIHHVGYLARVDGRWRVIEAKGVMYGVVISPLTSAFNAWGKMDKYFDYGEEEESSSAGDAAAEPVLKKGRKGADVTRLQNALLRYDAGCLPKYGADGDFGAETEKALRAYQASKGLDADGICGSKTYAALKEDGYL